MVFNYINFALCFVSFLGLAVTYLVSLQPKKRAEQIGKKAWKQSKHLRTVGFVFEVLGIITLILWKWYPIAILNWQIHSNPQVGLIIGICLGIPCLVIMSIGVFYAGRESWHPEKNGELLGGIYKYIRHPQAIGEFPLFIAIAFAVNSWFLVIFMTLYNLIYLPIMIKIEEADLLRRFGEKYRDYQKNTGMFFPKF
jgi:protein-S-isoprenylcysteine O-methyltransferase Ste14